MDENKMKLKERLDLPPEMSTSGGIAKFEEELEDNSETSVNQYKFLEDAISAGIEESKSSDDAKKLGLIHRGFGKYSKDKKSPILYHTKNGKLTRYLDPETKQSKSKRENESGSKTEKEKEEEKYHKKKPKTGLTNVKRIDSDPGKAAFSFKYNGESSSMVFTKYEYKLMIKKHIAPSKIILSRLKKMNQKKKELKKGESEEFAERRRLYKQKKKELGPERRGDEKSIKNG